MKYLAHIASDGREQTVRQHLEGTALLAKRFASSFGGQEDGRLAGQLHDIGKYSRAFQKRLLDNGPRVDHSTAGAQEAFHLRNLPVALSVAGHHGGIPDLGSPLDPNDEPTLQGRMKRKTEPCDAWKQEIQVQPNALPAWLSRKDSLSIAFYTRMIYSCLVDADFQDTQDFINGTPAPRGEGEPLHRLLPKVRRQAEKYLSQEKKDVVSLARNRVLRDCIEKGKTSAQGLYTLTVPTGGGKTFASLAFAMEQAAAQGMKRIIYVIPYTSSIDQTARIFTDLLGEENVLAHYSDVDYQLIEPDEKENPLLYRKLLDSENWDAPVIVTTAVQFFESIYSNRSSRCRKLHNLAESVIIFDEAQTIPNDYLLPCLSAIGQLVRFYRTTAVLCTATQPAIARFDKQLMGLPITEIVGDCSELYQTLKRTVIRDLGSCTRESLGKMLAENEQILCVVNKRKTAQELYQMLPEEGSFCLTTLLCPLDRKRKFDEIRTRLSQGLPCRVVSTSLIEAGVDVDFPSAYREDCGLDSLLQTAGRCNREGKRPAEQSIVYRFSLEGEEVPQMLAKNKSALEYAARGGRDLFTPEAVERYFHELFQLKEEALDKKGILSALCPGKGGNGFAFAWVSEQFKLIETPVRTVYLPIEEGEELCRELRNGEGDRLLLRKLGRYSVDCYEKQFDLLDQAGALELLPDGSAILIDLTWYSRETGLSNESDGGGYGLFI